MPCDGETTAGANMRFRLNPEVHVSDNLRVVSQIDILDNVVLGSTPEGSAFGPSASGGYESLARSGYTPIGLLDNTAVPPSAGQNSVEDSIRVKRVWGEYSTPVGQLRFGRMPNHWGLGMVMNAGDGHDDDAQSTIDRLMFASTLKPLDLTIAGAWDFPNEGLTKSSATTGNPAYDRAQGDDVDQYTLILLRQKSQELEKLFLTRGNVIVNGGLNLSYRRQMLDSVSANTPDLTGADASNSFARRDANMWVPDLWLQVLYKKFRFESELAMVYETISSTEMTADNGGDFGATSTTAAGPAATPTRTIPTPRVIWRRARTKPKSTTTPFRPSAFTRATASICSCIATCCSECKAPTTSSPVWTTTSCARPPGNGSADRSASSGVVPANTCSRQATTATSASKLMPPCSSRVKTAPTTTTQTSTAVSTPSWSTACCSPSPSLG